MKDLLVVAADKDIEQSIVALLGRTAALKIRPVTHEVVVHPQRDPGCYVASRAIADGFARTCRHALVVFDRAWDGAPTHDPRALEQKVESDLAATWQGRAACVVIDPEIEAWAFSTSPRVDDALGWAGRSPALRPWLVAAGLWDPGDPKPRDPKRAFEAALRHVRRPNSSSIFRVLGSSVSVDRCVDASFARLRRILEGWFPIPIAPVT